MLAGCGNPSPHDLLDESADEDGWMAEAHRRISTDHASFREDSGVFTGGTRGLAATLDAQGLHARSGDDELTVRLGSWGREGAARAVPPVEPTWGDCASTRRILSDGTCLRRVEIPRAGLTEYWQPHDAGLEQGWTIDARPAGTGPLALNLELEGAMHWEVEADARGVHIVGSEGELWRYHGLE